MTIDEFFEDMREVKEAASALIRLELKNASANQIKNNHDGMEVSLQLAELYLLLSRMSELKRQKTYDKIEQIRQQAYGINYKKNLT